MGEYKHSYHLPQIIDNNAHLSYGEGMGFLPGEEPNQVIPYRGHDYDRQPPFVGPPQREGESPLDAQIEEGLRVLVQAAAFSKAARAYEIPGLRMSYGSSQMGKLEQVPQIKVSLLVGEEASRDPSVTYAKVLELVYNKTSRGLGRPGVELVRMRLSEPLVVDYTSQGVSTNVPTDETGAPTRTITIPVISDMVPDEIREQYVRGENGTFSRVTGMRPVYSAEDTQYFRPNQSRLLTRSSERLVEEIGKRLAPPKIPQGVDQVSYNPQINALRMHRGLAPTYFSEADAHPVARYVPGGQPGHTR